LESNKIFQMTKRDLPSAVGFLGLGAMGYPMAYNLRKNLPSTITVFVHDLDSSAIKKFQGETEDFGPVIIASSAKQLAEKTDFIVSVLPEGKHVKAAYLSKDVGVIAGLASGSKRKILADCSTIDIATSLEVGKAFSVDSNAVFVDTPISGGTIGAKNATLAFMVGTAEDDNLMTQLRPVLETMGKNIIACGAPSYGLGAKLANNYISGMTNIVTSEAMNLGMRIGLDKNVLQSVIKVSSGSNYINNVSNPVGGIHPLAPSSNNYTPGFTVQLMKKDIGLAVSAAKDVGAKLVLGDLGLQTYSEVNDDPKYKGLDCSVVYKFISGKDA
jgi:3-hydroxyisobutyrate dehydrogenase